MILLFFLTLISTNIPEEYTRQNLNIHTNGKSDEVFMLSGKSQDEPYDGNKSSFTNGKLSNGELASIVVPICVGIVIFIIALGFYIKNLQNKNEKRTESDNAINQTLCNPSI